MSRHIKTEHHTIPTIHYNEEIDYVILEVIALVIAFVIALISVGIMRLRMNTAKPKGTAMEYIKRLI